MRRLWRLSEPEPEKSAQRYNKYLIFANPARICLMILLNKICVAMFGQQNAVRDLIFYENKACEDIFLLKYLQNSKKSCNFVGSFVCK